MLRSVTRRATSGARRSARFRETEATSARYAADIELRETVRVTSAPSHPHLRAADFDAIVIGAGHNGLVTAAYLARAGMSTLLVEARADVGGTAASEQFAGATVNICNCDHLTFRTTPVIEELGLRALGLEYIDVEPAQHNFSWASAAEGRAGRTTATSMRRSTTSAATSPPRSTATAATSSAAAPAVRMIFEAACRAADASPGSPGSRCDDDSAAPAR